MFHSVETINSYMEDAKNITPDIKDADYFALALMLNCPLWSNDNKLKTQSRVKVYSTMDLMKLFEEMEKDN